MQEFSTWVEVSAEHVRVRPHEVALIEDDRNVTYAEFDRLCGGASAWLAAHGVKKGDMVAVWMVNRLDWLVLYFALSRLGASLMTINTRYRAHEVAYILEQSRATVLVLEPNFRKIDFPGILSGVDRAAARHLRQVVVVRAGAGGFRETVLGCPTVSFSLDALPDDQAPLCGTADGLNILFTTSGTTSGPKLVMHSQRNIAVHSQRVARAYGLTDPKVCLLAALPFGGVFGFNAAMGAFAAGCPVVLMDTFDGPRAAGLIRRHQVTHMFGSDEMFRRILEQDASDAPFPSVRVFGFAAFHPGMNEFGRQAWKRHVPLTGVYGSSEVQALFSLQRGQSTDELLLGGGVPANAAAEIRVRDIDTGALLPVGESGVIEIRADTNFLGYFNRPDATQAVIDAEGYFSTGDVGYLRPDGSFVYLTRRGDAMRLAGYLVSPVEIEDVLKDQAGIADAQVVSVDLDGKRCCVAFVTMRQAGAKPDEDALKTAVRATLAPFKVPARIWSVDAFPTTQSANGVKIQRAKLRDLAMEKLGETA
ncbi:MAG: acyl-CoA synthetase [Castellaniella sp.]|uniref:AMP-binding protein n=1 Tax=Castellaniella sp. TaxID=1955812 RepID=UPI0012240446|nr:AMP-binding protein [Castellaniella sp.]TAN29515.1 MAG: acyl-CoA synthetase [Castellaniella sp.]